jgi:DNA-binding GntR family transcriptional regulator
MNASDRIRDSIQARIQDGVLLPGDAIDEERLMAQFGVSRTPVREAMLQLKAEGLVSSLPRGGAMVSKLDVPQLFAMWELLAELEGMCARYACDRMNDAERRRLADAHREAEAVVARDDAEGWQQANRRFHEVLYDGARNPYLEREIMTMRACTQAYRIHAFSAVSRLRLSHDGHARIVAAIEAHDAQAAGRAGFAHLNPGGAPWVTDLIMKLPKALLA